MTISTPPKRPDGEHERTPEDARIVALLFERNEEAVERMQRDYGTYCRTVAMAVTGNREDAEECVNDTLLRAWNSIPPAKPSCIKAYLGKICRNIALDSYRRTHRKKRNREMETVLNELDEVAPDEIADSTFRQTLTEFLYTLNEHDRDLFVGRYWYAYSPATLAAEQGLTRNAVNLRLMRLREQLREYLMERGYTV